MHLYYKHTKMRSSYCKKYKNRNNHSSCANIYNNKYQIINDSNNNKINKNKNNSNNNSENNRRVYSRIFTNEAMAWRTTILQFIMAFVFYLTMGTSHADVINKLDLTPQYTGSSASASSSFSSSASASAYMARDTAADLAAATGSLTAAGGIGFVEPYLDGYATTNVTTQIGTHAYLPCRVKQLGNKSVSWIRVRDGHILTVDRAVFIADQRFLALKQPDKFWILQIKYVQARDAGAYECQVSTEPKVSARVHLQVVVPRTEILGDPDRYVKAGSTVILRCIVRGAIEPPTFIMWYHGSEQLSADSRRHRMQVDRNTPETEGEAHSTIGSLIMESAKKRDTGNYTCSPSNSPSVTVTLNIINGESSASAVTSSAPMNSACTAGILTLLLSVIIIGEHAT